LISINKSNLSLYAPYFAKRCNN